MPTIDKDIQQIYEPQALAAVFPGPSTLRVRVAGVSLVNFAFNARPMLSGRKEAA